MEVRHLAISLSKEEFYRQVEVLQLPGHNDAASTLWKMYSGVSRGFAMLANAHAHTAQETKWVFKISRRIEQGGVLPPPIASRLGRAFRSALGGGNRWHLVDEHTPRHLTSFWWWLSRAMALWLMLTLISFLPFRKKASL